MKYTVTWLRITMIRTMTDRITSMTSTRRRRKKRMITAHLGLEII